MKQLMRAKNQTEFNQRAKELKNKSIWKSSNRKAVKEYFQKNWFTTESIKQWSDCFRTEYHKQMETTQASESFNQLRVAC